MVLNFCELDLDVAGNRPSDLSAMVQLKPVLSHHATKHVKFSVLLDFLKHDCFFFHSTHCGSGWSRVLQVLQSVIQMQHIQKRYNNAHECSEFSVFQQFQ